MTPMRACLERMRSMTVDAWLLNKRPGTLSARGCAGQCRATNNSGRRPPSSDSVLKSTVGTQPSCFLASSSLKQMVHFRWSQEGRVLLHVAPPVGPTRAKRSRRSRTEWLTPVEMR
jgi:hypothetical protein